MYLQIKFLNIQDALKLNKNGTFQTNIFIEKLHSNQNACHNRSIYIKNI